MILCSCIKIPSFSLQASVARQWGPLAKLVRTCGRDAFTAVDGLEKRGVPLELGTFKDCEGLTPHFLKGACTYLNNPKCSLVRFKAMCKQYKK